MTTAAANSYGACACGMKGRAQTTTTGPWRGFRSVDISAMDRPIVHRCNWWWDSNAARMDGVCCETGIRHSDVAPMTAE